MSWFDTFRATRLDFMDLPPIEFVPKKSYRKKKGLQLSVGIYTT
jgi:hypothetical protein